jgi:hypothetical protein
MKWNSFFNSYKIENEWKEWRSEKSEGMKEWRNERVKEWREWRSEESEGMKE